MRSITQKLGAFCAVITLCGPLESSLAEAQKSDWGVGGYVGQFYDSYPEALLGGQDTNFLNQYIAGLTVSKTVWRSEQYPLSLEIEGLLAYQAGKASLGEIGVVPVFRWSGFPWNNFIQTDLRFGPVGLSWTSSLSPLERNSKGGSQWLNLLIVDLGFSLPGNKESEIFIRLQHRCSLFNIMNDYGTNGEDFLALGFRRNF